MAAHAWLLSADDYEISANGMNIVAFPKEYISGLSVLQQSLRVIQAGVTLAEVKGKDLIPNHALAMSTVQASDVFLVKKFRMNRLLPICVRKRLCFPILLHAVMCC